MRMNIKAKKRENECLLYIASKKMSFCSVVDEFLLGNRGDAFGKQNNHRILDGVRKQQGIVTELVHL